MVDAAKTQIAKHSTFEDEYEGLLAMAGFQAEREVQVRLWGERGEVLLGPCVCSNRAHTHTRYVRTL